MARKIIDTGIVGNDGTGDSIRDSFRKVNDNFRELYGSLGLGTRLTFLSLDETPNSFAGQENAVVAVNPTESAVIFKQIVGGDNVSVDFVSNENEIRITNTYTISSDPTPRLGANLSARGGAGQFTIRDLPPYPLIGADIGGPKDPDEAVSKAYADSKISLAGVNGIDPVTNTRNSSFGAMTGPLILSRDPVPDDDVQFDGLIAATKRYVDNAGFGSIINLYVATSGNDARVGVGEELQGRALSYAFRTIEAALRRAEEIVRAAPPEIGPYRKVLTFTNPTSRITTSCVLSGIETSPDSGSGYVGDALMSVDTIQLATGGFNYQVGDFVFINPPTTESGVTQSATIEVLSVNSQPGTPNGPIVTFRLLTGGVFLDLPGSTNVNTTSSSAFGEQATFNVTYRVNNVRTRIDSESGLPLSGSGYGLVSVRLTPQVGDTGSGAFGFADVVNGQIASITITDGGSNFKSVPSLDIDLPRFKIFTGGFRTDFTGDLGTETEAAKRTRDIREGLFLEGVQSRALAQILAHSGELDSDGNELFDVDIKFGAFIPGEEIAYGDVANTVQIAINIESGIYEENLPLKVSQNVSMVGNEFRRVIVRPRPGPSSSPWAFTYFRRDRIIDGNTTAKNAYNAALTDTFGYHYLSEADRPVYPLIDNKGFYRAASSLLKLNKQFIQEEVAAWISNQIENEIPPFDNPTFEYNETVFKRDAGLIIDAMVFDLLYGGNDRVISAALKYRDTASGRIAITDQLSQTSAAISRINVIAQMVIKNLPIFKYSQFNQIIDRAFVGEVGTGGIPIEILGITKSDQGIVVQTSGDHGFEDGEPISFTNVGGSTELNGNTYFVERIDSTRFYPNLRQTLNTRLAVSIISDYTTGGSVIPKGGVIGAFTDAILDVISDSNAVNYPVDNDQMDVFLMNDATILRAVTVQGAGGFAMILDPVGQILAKSPYAQEGSVFSKSTGRKTFAGGLFVDGFTGNIKFKILNKISNIRLEVGELQRFPQLPASFIVDDRVYRINYVRDFSFSTTGSTATFVLDETTPWPFPVFSYNEAACSRDVGLIISGVSYDIVFGSNYHAKKAGLTYRQANASVVIENQLGITTRAINYAHELAKNEISALTAPIGQSYDGVIDNIESSRTIITNIIRRGATAAPAWQLPNPPGLPLAKSNAKSLILSNLEFIKDEVLAYMEDLFPLVSFDIARSKRDTEYVTISTVYDLIYGGNSQSVDAGLKYYDGILNAIESQLEPEQVAVCAAGIGRAKAIVRDIIQNITVTPTSGNTTLQIIAGSSSDSNTADILDTLFDIVIDYISTGDSSESLVYPDLNDFAYDSLNLSANSVLSNSSTITAIQAEVIDFVDETADVYEVLMPGNRSMLSNDFTQICDLGYGLVATNGGLTEAVSMFTYYNHISYYSLNGGQIRSVAGSSAHGNYALIAEGSDPLEVPTPVDAYYEFSQGVTVFNDGALFDNIIKEYIVYVGDYDYPPRDFSELEIDHGGTLGIARYPVISAVTEDGFPLLNDKPVYRLNISADGDGLLAEIPDGTKATLRINTELILTGDVVGVATRPSTALILNESRGFAGASTDIQNLYRVLKFTEYVAPEDETQSCTISTGDNTVILTETPHRQLPGYLVFFTSTGTLPTGIFVNQPYYVLDDGYTATTFKISTARDGTPVITSSAGSGDFFFTPTGLAETTLREGYDYVEATVFPRQPYEEYGNNLLVGPAKITSGVSYRIISVGSTGSISDFTLVGASSNAPGTVFTASGPITPELVTTSSITDVVGTGQVFANDSICTFDFTADKILKTSHGFNNGDIIRFETTGSMPQGLFSTRQYFVFNKGTNDFQVVSYPGSVEPVEFLTNGSGITGVGSVIGEIGDSIFAVVPIGTNDRRRIDGMKFNLKGVDYTVTQYETEGQTGEQFARFNITPPLEDSVNKFASPITLKCAVPARSEGAQGTLTIRISLTRVTGHDLLDIGTGSYADTNYPNEIYGPPVRAATETLLDISGELDYSQVVERGEGRCFFVTTDQFGNFSVGPFFRVDQGTGTVTFSASIALSNLDGIGFKRGVPVSEFSTDSAFSDNATDTVPTENATRTYIDRRLGISHEGFNVEDDRLIPPGNGGFLAVNGQSPMRGNLNIGSTSITKNRIINLSDPIDPEDAVNFRSLKVANLQDFNLAAAKASSIFTFTGDGTTAIPANIDGDIFVPEDGITTGLDSTLNQLNIFIKPEIIDNANISPTADIAQSKLVLKAADTAAAAPASPDQSVLGLARFKNTEFTATRGWIELQTATSASTGVTLNKIQHLTTDTVIGRSATGTGAASAVSFTTIIDEGFAVKKNQYSSTGFLRRSGATNTLDADYQIVDMASGYVGTVDTNANGRLVVRDSFGDFGGRKITASVDFNIGSRKITDITTTATGGSNIFYGFGTGSPLVQRPGLSLSDGSLSTDKVNTYQNDNHLFRNLTNTAFAPIQVSQITASTLTTGGATTPGTITGNWTATTTSNLTFGTGILDIQNGTLKSRTLTTGDSTTSGIITGDWSMASTSNITFGTGILDVRTGTLRSRTLDAGAAGTTGTITGNWSLTSTSNLTLGTGIIDARTGTLRSRTLDAGAVGTTGTITGDWSLTSTSNLTLGTGTINASTGTLRSITLTTGAAATAGTITGNWSMASTSNITFGTGTLNVATGTLQSITLTTGAAATAGTITGNWSMASTSNLTLGTGIIDARTGTLRSRTLNTGASATTGTVEGTWTIAVGSSFAATTAGSAGSATNATNSANAGITDTTTTNATFYPTFVDGTSGNRAVRVDSSTLTYNPSTNALTTGTFVGNLTTGAAATAGTITGDWSLGSTSNITVGTGIIDARTGTLRSRTLNTGASATTGTVEGTWTIAVGSSFAATTATNATNSANAGITDTTTTNATFYPTFVDGTSGNRAVRIDSSTLTYNPNTNTLTTVTFAGNLVGTSARVTTLTTGASSTAGTVTGNWSLSSGSRFQATYADLAEYYEGDQEYAVGTVVVFGGGKEITISTSKGDTKVAGVVSDTGAYIMNQGCQGIKVCIALQGRVPCRVVGKIRKGDILTTSSVKGVAVAADGDVKVGTVVGKALENYDSDHIGTIEVAVGRT
jgi:hypothetical protein